MSTDIINGSQIQHLRRDASKLYRLIEQVESYLRSHRASFAYPVEADLFFDYLEATASTTKAFLKDRMANLSSHGDHGENPKRLRRTILTLADCQRSLKPNHE